MFVFRRRRCSQIVVSTPAGNLTISRNVIEGTARRVLRDIGELDVRRIRLYRKGKNYSLLLCCTFFDGGKSVPDIAEGIRNEIRDTLQNLFGIKTLRRIDFHAATPFRRRVRSGGGSRPDSHRTRKQRRGRNS